jgi:hypothetical protein
MNRRILTALMFMALIATSAARAAGLEVTVVSVEGEETQTTLADSDSGLKFEPPVALKDVAEIRFGSKAQAGAGAAVYLRNGDVLQNIKIVSGDDTKLVFKSETIGDVTLENKYIHALTFTPKDRPTQDVIDAFLKGPKQKEDLLLTPKGESLTGYFEKFTDKDVSFNAGGQSRAYAFDAIVGLRLAPLEDFKATADPVATLVLRDGSRVTGKVLGLKEKKLKVEALNAQPWSVPAESLASLEFKGGKMVYLSDLVPASVEEKPYVGGAPLVFKWRKDRSASGGKISLAGKDYDRGIGVHSYARLTFNLEGQYAKFLCDTGLDASASASAASAWKVLVDGKEAAAGLAKAGEKPQPVKIELKGASKLELICDYGPDDDDAGDVLDWAGARLIKP